MEGQIAVVMVPFPLQSHLNSLLHLTHIITSYGLPVHFATSATHNRQAKARIQGWDSKSLDLIQFHDLELPPYTTPPPNPDPSMPFPIHLLPLFDASAQLRQPVCHLLQQLSPMFRKVVVIHDSGMSCVVQDVKLTIPNGESYNFLPISAFSLFLSFRNAISETPFEVDCDDLPSKLPSDEGCMPPEVEKWAMEQFKYLGLESGRIYNTSMLIEGRYVELLRKLTEKTEIKHFAIGPFNPIEAKTVRENQKHRCLKWLDEQEENSILYVSFGSTTSLTNEQIRELAIGLENSGEKFLWVLRTADRGDVFADSEVDQLLLLPEGFEERVINRGIVIREWAPQLDILAHRSTGGFMSHCGWNSCLESITMGVPIAAWPMHSDQPKNAALITEVLKIGTLVRNWSNRTELVTSITIENAVKTLIANDEGAEMRKRAVDLSVDVRGSVAKGGASSFEMDAFIAHITR